MRKKDGMRRITVNISNDNYECLQNLNNETGMPVQNSVDQILTQFFRFFGEDVGAQLRRLSEAVSARKRTTE